MRSPSAPVAVEDTVREATCVGVAFDVDGVVGGTGGRGVAIAADAGIGVEADPPTGAFGTGGGGADGVLDFRFFANFFGGVAEGVTGAEAGGSRAAAEDAVEEAGPMSWRIMWPDGSPCLFATARRSAFST